MRKKIIFTLLLLGLVLSAMNAIAFAQTPVSVTIGHPSNPADLGIISGGYWIGQFPITITSGGTSTSVEVYCQNYLGTVYMGATYPANIVTVDDTQTWRAISYILSWDTPTDNNQAAIEQVAIWRLLYNSNNPPPYNPNHLNLASSIETSATELALLASDKNVARQGDQLTWVSPSSGSTSANPGDAKTFQVQLTAPKPNVRIDFTATLIPPSGPSTTLDSANVNPMQAFTDNNGQAQVTVKVPSDAPYGSTIKVEASTQSVWPQKYLDLTSNNPTLQNLIGLGPALGLTTSCNLLVLGYITVVPESAYGALTAIVAFGAAFIIYSKHKLIIK